MAEAGVFCFHNGVFIDLITRFNAPTAEFKALMRGSFGVILGRHLFALQFFCRAESFARDFVNKGNSHRAGCGRFCGNALADGEQTGNFGGVAADHAKACACTCHGVNKVERGFFVHNICPVQRVRIVVKCH